MNYISTYLKSTQKSVLEAHVYEHALITELQLKLNAHSQGAAMQYEISGKTYYGAHVLMQFVTTNKKLLERYDELMQTDHTKAIITHSELSVAEIRLEQEKEFPSDIDYSAVLSEIEKISWTSLDECELIDLSLESDDMSHAKSKDIEATNLRLRFYSDDFDALESYLLRATMKFLTSQIYNSFVDTGPFYFYDPPRFERGRTGKTNYIEFYLSTDITPEKIKSLATNQLKKLQNDVEVLVEEIKEYLITDDYKQNIEEITEEIGVIVSPLHVNQRLSSETLIDMLSKLDVSVTSA